MTVLLDMSIARTLDDLVHRFGRGGYRGSRLDAWLFEDADARRQAERTLAASGVQARLRSAYKPLLHFFLEEVDRSGLADVTIAVPTHGAGSLQRFALEAYPLAGLLPGVPIRFELGVDELAYRVSLVTASAEAFEHLVFAPNRLRSDHLGQPTLCPVGWLRLWTEAGATPAIDEALETEFEAVFRHAVNAVGTHRWPGTTPYFETLEITVQTSGIERSLEYGDELMSTREALHEDCYFSLLEWFQRRAGGKPGERMIQPGQIVPDIRAGPGATRLRVEVGPPLIPEERGTALPSPIETADAPLPLADIPQALAVIGGQTFSFRSAQGRMVCGAYSAGTSAGVVITAGQHGNEASGVVGALRAGRRLKAKPELRFALVPLENPDGYALHQRLRRDHPQHMHHAARYTALGDDLEARQAEPLHEAAARREAIHLTDARLHISLHGYPAHEWTRPLSGYLPRGFELWTIPKGFFLILRHQPGLGARAEAFVRALARRLGRSSGLCAYNEAQLAVYRAHAGEIPFAVHHSIPCLVTERAQSVALTLITEFPDETIYGDAFRLAHTTQMNAVLAATDIFLTDCEWTDA